jgi:uncharacterized membrane protein SpoIIM required for sporulation
LESRRLNWRELEQLCSWMEGRSRRIVPARAVTRFSTLYRAACADLALADAYQFPPGTVHYLHQLVGRAHNQLYRSRTFNMGTWVHELFVRVPQRLFADNYLRLAFVIFWGMFLLSGIMAYSSPEYTERVIGRLWMERLDEDFSQPVSSRDFYAGGAMAGFYILNNASIGLRCFAFGLLLGIGGLFTTVRNATFIGASFGYMGNASQPLHFFHFVTAHGPLELTAIVLSAAAGMRLGFSLIDTKGFTRSASLRLAAQVAMPTACAAIVMFLLAALIEAFLSPSAAPYWIKAAVAIISSGMLMFYFVFLGYPRGD